MVENKVIKLSLKSPPAPNLAKRKGTFVGRDSVLSDLDRLFFTEPETEVVVLKAIGGTGKSWLANEFGHRVKEKSKTRS